jgi:hypothetical protein
VLDRYGTVIGHSDRPVPQETPSIHVDAFIGWLGTMEGFAGQRVLAEEMGRLYATEFCPAHGLEPFPWQTIAAELTGMPDIISRKYHPVPGSPGRKRVLLCAGPAGRCGEPAEAGAAARVGSTGTRRHRSAAGWRQAAYRFRSRSPGPPSSEAAPSSMNLDAAGRERLAQLQQGACLAVGAKQLKAGNGAGRDASLVGKLFAAPTA